MLERKVALVTGGTGGIGKAICLKLAQDGTNIAFTYNSKETVAEELKLELEQLGIKALAYRCNVSSYCEVQSTVKQVLNDFLKIDILVNNAGITKDKLVISMDEEDFDSVINVNLKGAFNFVKQLYPHFARRKSGRIINISSVSGLFGNAGQSNYSASKAGLIGLTKSIAKELATRNITCNAVAPGLIDTAMTKDLVDSPLLKNIPMNRIGKPDEVASLVSFLASDSAAYITGEVIRVDGGLAM